jgi:plastocyanin
MRSAFTNKAIMACLLVAAMGITQPLYAQMYGDPPAKSSGATSTATPQTKPSAVGSISIKNFTFSPAKITVPVGTKVTWTNQDDTAHRVMITDLKKGSSALDTGDAFSYTFTKPGTYKYFCTLHPQMVGSVTVTAASHK